MLPISVRQATLEDISLVSEILCEAALWLEHQNMALWGEAEVSPEVVCQDIEAGLFYIVFYESSAAGVVKFQTEDLVFWSDVPQGDSAFIHRLGRVFKLW